MTCNVQARREFRTASDLWAATPSDATGPNPASEGLQPQAVHDPAGDRRFRSAGYSGFADCLRTQVPSAGKQPGDRRIRGAVRPDLSVVRGSDVRSPAQSAQAIRRAPPRSPGLEVSHAHGHRWITAVFRSPAREVFLLLRIDE